MILRELRRWARAPLFLLVAACGGSVVGGGDGGAGGSGAGATTSTTSTTQSATASTTTGGGCGDGCPPDRVCIWNLGQCAPVCAGTGPGSCGPGLVCNDCAGSSCEGCLDCLQACVPPQNGECDDHDDCPAGFVCLYGEGKCAPICETDADCVAPMFCDSCATPACPICAACMPACVSKF